MDTAKKQFKTVDDYIATFPKDVQGILEKIRYSILESAPDAVEVISYQMPAFKLKGKILVYYASWKKHIGFYATPSGNEAFKKELSRYKVTKGSVHFPIERPVPYHLIKQIVDFRMKEISQQKS